MHVVFNAARACGVLFHRDELRAAIRAPARSVPDCGANCHLSLLESGVELAELVARTSRRRSHFETLCRLALRETGVCGRGKRSSVGTLVASEQCRRPSGAGGTNTMCGQDRAQLGGAHTLDFVNQSPVAWLGAFACLVRRDMPSVVPQSCRAHA